MRISIQILLICFCFSCNNMKEVSLYEFKALEVNPVEKFSQKSIFFDSVVIDFFPPKLCHKPRVIGGNRRPLFPQRLYSIFSYLFLSALKITKKIYNN